MEQNLVRILSKELLNFDEEIAKSCIKAIKHTELQVRHKVLNENINDFSIETLTPSLSYKLLAHYENSIQKRPKFIKNRFISRYKSTKGLFHYMNQSKSLRHKINNSVEIQPGNVDLHRHAISVLKYRKESRLRSMNFSEIRKHQERYKSSIKYNEYKNQLKNRQKYVDNIFNSYYHKKQDARMRLHLNPSSVLGQMNGRCLPKITKRT